MHTYRLTRGAIAVLLSLGATLGCEDGTPLPHVTPPSPVTTPAIQSISPAVAAANTSVEVTISGTGFEPGATVTFDGTPASVSAITKTTITAMAPPRASGAVTVAVTNPTGGRGELPGGFSYLAVMITSVTPSRGLIGTHISIAGIGLHRAATVSVGGEPAAANHGFVGSGLLVVAPNHAVGRVDLVITNPDGQRAMLAGGYTYEPVTIASSVDSVQVQGTLSVVWAGPEGRTTFAKADWIGLFQVGAASENYDIDDVWWQYTNGVARGEFHLPAPSVPGDYEFRYLAEDGYLIAAKSATVRVVAALAAPNVPTGLQAPGALIRPGGRTVDPCDESLARRASSWRRPQERREKRSARPTRD